MTSISAPSKLRFSNSADFITISIAGPSQPQSFSPDPSAEVGIFKDDVHARILRYRSIIQSDSDRLVLFCQPLRIDPPSFVIQQVILAAIRQYPI